jgi:hypothetical protein
MSQAAPQTREEQKALAEAIAAWQPVDTERRVRVKIQKVPNSSLQDPLPINILGDDNHPDPRQRRTLSYSATIPHGKEVAIPEWVLPTLTDAVTKHITDEPAPGQPDGVMQRVAVEADTVPFQILGFA